MDEYQKLRIILGTIFAIAHVVRGEDYAVQTGVSMADDLLEQNGIVQPDLVVEPA